jgi:hypothetical protein
MELVNAIGGGRAGWVNATWPLARLTASPNELVLRFVLGGRYSFSPTEVVKLEPYGKIPALGQGVRIVHSRIDYPERLIFWHFTKPEALIHRIHAAGFVPTGTDSDVPPRRGVPFRWTAVAVTVLLWNVLFLVDYQGGRRHGEPGPLALVALGLVFTIATVTKASPAAQRLVLKPGRHMGEIREALSLLQLIAGFMLVIIALSSFGPGSRG